MTCIVVTGMAIIFNFVTYCLHVYIIYVRGSLAVIITDRFHC